MYTSSSPMLNFDPDEIPIDTVIRKLKSTHIPKNMSAQKQKASDMFWQTISNDIDIYSQHINKRTPFHKTCYSVCDNICIRKWDKAYWTYMTVGYRKRAYISVYKFPIKLLSIFLLFCAGLLKLIRVHQDGKASFYGNLITAINHIIVFCLLMVDGEYAMSIPKIAGFVVTTAIVIGIIVNAEEEIGL